MLGTILVHCLLILSLPVVLYGDMDYDLKVHRMGIEKKVNICRISGIQSMVKIGNNF